MSAIQPMEQNLNQSATQDRIRSPKAYQIKSKMRKDKSQNVQSNYQKALGSSRRAPNAHEASYFFAKGEHSIKKLA